MITASDALVAAGARHIYLDALLVSEDLLEEVAHQHLEVLPVHGDQVAPRLKLVEYLAGLDEPRIFPLDPQDRGDRLERGEAGGAGAPKLLEARLGLHPDEVQLEESVSARPARSYAGAEILPGGGIDTLDPAVDDRTTAHPRVHNTTLSGKARRNFAGC